jgi:ankyrin repeat protein
MFNPRLYGQAIAASPAVSDGIVCRVLSEHKLASLKLLLDHGLPVDHIGNFFPGGHTLRRDFALRTMLGFLCEHSQSDDQERSVPLARLLIQRGPDIKAKTSHSNTSLHSAIVNNNFPLLALLLAHGADANVVGFYGASPLHCASYWPFQVNADKKIHWLIAHGADIEARDPDGNTALILATSHNHNSMAALLKHNADASAHNRRGETSLHFASWMFESQHVELAKSLLDHGANVNAADIDGKTPLHWLLECHEGDKLPMAKFLLENGADVHAISNIGDTPLRSALVCKCGADVVGLLFDHGADFRGFVET